VQCSQASICSRRQEALLMFEWAPGVNVLCQTAQWLLPDGPVVVAVASACMPSLACGWSPHSVCCHADRYEQTSYHSPVNGCLCQGPRT
jgi:hypothetical protein